MRRLACVGQRTSFQWHRVQYATGLRHSQLVTGQDRPQAAFRAVVMGLATDAWADFDAAYPEYQLYFAPADLALTETQAIMCQRNIAVIVFDRTPQPSLDVVLLQSEVPVFYAAHAPLPVLRKQAKSARGFLIDTMGPLNGSSAQTETNTFLDHFDLTEDPSLVAAGERLVENLHMNSQGSDCLVIANHGPTDRFSGHVQTNTELMNFAHAQTTDKVGDCVLFQAHLHDPWYSNQVLAAFMAALDTCNTVVVEDAELGLVALLVGRRVIVTGIPLWSGYGLTHDNITILRNRDLSPAAFAAIVLVLLARYVDADGTIINPADGWTV